MSRQCCRNGCTNDAVAVVSGNDFCKVHYGEKADRSAISGARHDVQIANKEDHWTMRGGQKGDSLARRLRDGFVNDDDD